MKKFLKILAILAAVCVVVLIAAYWYFTSSGFITKVVLPKVSDAAGVRIVAAEVNVSPFSKVEVKDLQIGEEAEPLVKANVMRCRYGLMDMVKGNLKVDEVLVEGVHVSVVEDEQGTWNFPGPVTSSEAPAEESPAAKKPSGGAPPKLQFNIKDVHFKDISVSVRRAPRDGQPGLELDLTGVEFHLPELKNGAAVEATWKAGLRVLQKETVEISGATLEGTLKTQLDTDGMPLDIQLTTTATIPEGKAGDIPLSGRRAGIEVAAEVIREGDAVKGWRVTRHAITEDLNGARELDISMSGQFMLESKSADLVIVTKPIAPTLLELIGLPELPPMTETVELSVASPDDRTVEVRKLTVRWDKGDEPLLLVSGTGKLVQTDALAVEFTLGSELVNGKAIEALLPKAEPTEEEPQEQAEPAEAAQLGPIDLGGLKADITLDLKNITYGDVKIETCTGKVQVADNKVVANPVDLSVNGAPIHIETTLDLGKPGFGYDLALGITDLPLEPFVTTFTPHMKMEFDGGLKRLNLKAAGAGLTVPEILRNLTADLDTAVDGFSLPKKVSAKEKPHPLVNIVLVPIRALRDIGKLAPGGVLPPKVRELRDKANELLSEAGKIEFMSGEMSARMQEGKLDIPKVNFHGDVIKDLDISGALDFSQFAAADPAAPMEINAGLDLQVKMNVMGIPVSMPVKGTLLEPEANAGGLLKGLATDMGKGVLDVATKAITEGKKLDPKDLLKGIVPKGDSGETKEGEEDKKEGEKEELKDKGRDLIKGLFK